MLSLNSPRATIEALNVLLTMVTESSDKLQKRPKHIVVMYVTRAVGDWLQHNVQAMEPVNETRKRDDQLTLGCRRVNIRI